MLNTVERLKHGQRAVVVCAGDSITQQNYHVNGYLNYVGYLDEKLPNARVINVGVSGDTTDGFLKRFDADVRHFTPDLVTVMFGMNDASFGENALPAFENNLAQIAQLIKQMRAEMLFLTQNPVMCQVHDAAVQARCAYREYAACIRRFTAENAIPLCDIERAWQNHIMQNPLDTWRMMSDGIHPNERGQRFIAKTLFESLSIENALEV